MPLYLGLDSSTQGLSAIVISVEGEDRRVVFESSLSFDESLPHYGTTHGVLPRTDPKIATSSPAQLTKQASTHFSTGNPDRCRSLSRLSDRHWG